MEVATLPTGTASIDAARWPRWHLAAWSLIGYLLLVLVAWSAPPGDRAEAPRSSEQQVKAAFLYKFLSYVEWPAGALRGESSPIVVGVLGADDVAGDLRAIVERRGVGQHPVEVRQVGEGDALDGVNALFIGAGAAEALPRLARAAQQHSVLLVTDFANALARGSVINLVVVDDRVRFEVSLEAAERSELKLSSRMLGVALWVRPSH